MGLFKKIDLKLRKYLMSNEGYARYQGVQFGENCRLNVRDWGTEPFLVSIGNKVGIAAGTVLLTHDGSSWLNTDAKGRRHIYRRIKIGSNVMIGSNSIIMPGVEIGDDVIVAAGSVVIKSIPKGCIVGGNPARIIGDFYEHQAHVLANCPSDLDRDRSKGFKEDVLSLVDETFKPMLLKK